MTLLIASVIADTPRALIERAEAAWAQEAEAVELRIDGLTGQTEEMRDYIASRPDRQFLLTCRSVAEGGRFSGTDEHKEALYRPLMFLDNVMIDAEFIGEADIIHDVEAYSTGDTKGALEKPEEISPGLWARIQEAMSTIRETGELPAWLAKPRHILSSHHFDDKPVNAKPILDFASKVGAVGAIAKVAYAAGHIAASFDALDLAHEFRERVIAIAMGEDGLWTRLLAKKLGAFGTFASLDADAATAPGQLTLDEMLNLYRWRDIDANTKVFGVIGDPVAHSLSPTLFNRWFAEAGINAVYLPLRVRGGDEGLRRFLAECVARPWLDVGGFSVTVPHKEAALAWMGTPSDNLTRSVGALNTLCFRDGKAYGYNTDCYAAVSSVATALGRQATDLAGLRVHVLGAGGAARAILEGFGEAGCHVTVFARSFAQAAKLGEQFRSDAAPWEERGRQPADLLINTTPVGMWPNVNESPMDDIASATGPGPGGPRDQGERSDEATERRSDAGERNQGVAATSRRDSLRNYRLVFDLIYRPLETKLLRDAKAAGCQTLSGLDMFIRQAAVQFELWTAKRPNVSGAREWIFQQMR